MSSEDEADMILDSSDIPVTIQLDDNPKKHCLNSRSPSSRASESPTSLTAKLNNGPPSSSSSSSSSWEFFDHGVVIQSTLPLLASIFGLLATGWLMDIIQHWDVFVNLSELFIVMPILLNLRGNIEMNLASRVSTVAHFDWFSVISKRNRYLLYNFSVIQIQCLVVGTLAGISAFLLGGIFHLAWNSYYETMLMVTTCVITACVSSALCGIITIWAIIFSWRLKIDPDNIATPIAASLGDLITLFFLAMFGDIFYRSHENPVLSLIFVFLIGSFPFWLNILRNNEPEIQQVESHDEEESLIYQGWVPLLVAMVITGCAGVLQERFVQRYEGAALLLPVFNGIAQNISSIYVSRFSTFLHLNKDDQQGKGETKVLAANTERTLIFLNLPMQVIFLVFMIVFHLGHTEITFWFLFLYIIGSYVLTWVVVQISKELTKYLWRNGYDPDNYALPYTSSICDLIGTSLLLLIFLVIGFK